MTKKDLQLMRRIGQCLQIRDALVGRESASMEQCIRHSHDSAYLLKMLDKIFDEITGPADEFCEEYFEGMLSELETWFCHREKQNWSPSGASRWGTLR